MTCLVGGRLVVCWNLLGEEGQFLFTLTLF